MIPATYLDGYDRAKRLTDPELAAEHHAAVLDVYRSKVHGVPTLEALERMAATIRFCLNDHYDEGEP